MKLSKILLATLCAITLALPAEAQNTAMSPYTRYGYGNLSDNATSAQRSMGGVGYAMNSGRQINVMNPASYAMMDSLTFLFDMGVDFTTLWSKDGDVSESDFGGGLDYVTMQVPIIKGLGASVGLIPYSSVGYSFGTEIDNGSVTRNGSGSLNQLYLGLGGRLFKGFGVGVNVAYLFGTIVNAHYATTDGASTSLFEREISVRDWRLDIGAQYSFYLNPNNRVTLGVVYSPKKDLHGNTYGIYYDATADNVTPDTVNVGNTRLAGQYSVPETWGAGINWNYANRLMVEVDYTYQPWSKAKFGVIENFETTEFADRWRVGAGLQYTPNPRGSYFSRVNYRVGGYYNHDYVMVLGNNVREYGVSMGFGIPVPGYKTTVNLGIEYRNRQATPQPLIKENYLNITLGINFNEMWFRKSKIY